MTQHWFETVDFQPPSLPAIQQGLDVLEQARTSGHSAYVHCKAGKGRSAVVTACYLMKVYTCTCTYICSPTSKKLSLLHKGVFCAAAVQ